jgi:HEAT repeat protein
VSPVVPLLAAILSAPGPTRERWPTWPTQLDPVREAIARRGEHPLEVVLQLLERASALPDPLVVEFVDATLASDDPELQRWGLGECRRRHLAGCGPAALRIWKASPESTVRSAALSTLALAPDEAAFSCLLEGLDDPNELMRAHAALAIAEAPLPTHLQARARKEIGARLRDESARVRAAAAEGVGLLGSGDGSLALVALFEDPDMSVREAAIAALGSLAEPRAAAPLRRLLARPPTPAIARAAVDALARTPGAEVDSALVALLDAPSENLDRADVVRAIGLRTAPSAELAPALVDRLREPELREDALAALLLLGDAALPALEAGLERGLAPHVRLEVERVVAARAAETAPRPSMARPAAPGPAIDPSSSAEVWRAALAGPGAVEAAIALARADPPWLSDAAGGVIAGLADARAAAPFALALAGADSARVDGATVAHLARFALDPGADDGARCAAAWALARARGPSARRTLAAVARSRSAAVRACATTSLGRRRDMDAVELGLADPDPVARAAAALASASAPQGRDVVARLRALSVRDPHPAVRANARWALSAPEPAWQLTAVDGSGPWFALEAAPGSASAPAASVVVRAVGDGADRFALVPFAPPPAPQDAPDRIDDIAATNPVARAELDPRSGR